VRSAVRDTGTVDAVRKVAQTGMLGQAVFKASMAAGAGLLVLWLVGTIAFLAWGGV
jgi:hypothetical protein